MQGFTLLPIYYTTKRKYAKFGCLSPIGYIKSPKWRDVSQLGLIKTIIWTTKLQNPKRDARNPILNTLRKTTSLFSLHARNQQVPPHNCSFECLIWTYNCRQIPIGVLHAEIMARAGLLNVFRIGFPASFLWKMFSIIILISPIGE